MGLFDMFKKGKKEENEAKQEFDGKVIAPISGTLMPLSEVPDEVFAQKMVGDGVAIKPNSNGVMLAPASGRVEKIFDTNHAFSIVTPAGVEIFVHFGMDTVQLEGKGFKRIAEEGAIVKVGDPLIEYDYEFLKENAKSIITPVIISNYEDYQALNPVESGETEAGKTVVLDIQK